MRLVDIPRDVKIPSGLIRKLPKRRKNIRDMTGWIIGELKVIGYVGKIRELSPTTRYCRLYWLCQCQCGRYRIIRTNDAKTVSRCRYCTLKKKAKQNPTRIGRDFRINFRVFFTERQELKKHADLLGISLQDFCLQTLLNEARKNQNNPSQLV